MPKSRAPCTAEYRARILELVRSGRTPESLSKELEPSAPTIRSRPITI